MSYKLTFLGTGAAGGTPGRGKSLRLESSLYIRGEKNILIDVTTDFKKQAKYINGIDFILFTHGHRDAAGGIAQLRAWWLKQKREPIPVYTHPQTIAVIRRRFKHFDHLLFKGSVLPRTVLHRMVPHAGTKFPTYAWKIKLGDKTLVYASDIARLTSGFHRFCRDIDLLIVDGAMWNKFIFSHLTIDQVLPQLCHRIKRIYLTQIGKTAPPHQELEKEVKRLCPQALPAYDGLVLTFDFFARIARIQVTD